MNDNDIFLKELEPFYRPLIYKGKLPEDLLFKPIFGNKYEILDLSSILAEAEENRINPFKAISFFIKKGNAKDIDYQKGLLLCSRIIDLPQEQSNFISSDVIDSICSITSLNASYAERIKLYVRQLKIIGLVEDNEFKKKLSLQKYRQILDIKDNSENQLIIFNHWKKFGFNVDDIKEIVPSIVSESPAVETVKKEFYIVKMDCNKIAKDKNLKKSEKVFLVIEFILGRLSEFDPEIYEYKKSQEQSNSIEILTLRNPDILNKAIDVFLNQLVENKMINKVNVSSSSIASSSYNDLSGIVTKEKFNSIMFHFNLDKKLDSVNVNKKSSSKI